MTVRKLFQKLGVLGVLALMVPCTLSPRPRPLQDDFSQSGAMLDGGRPATHR